MRWYLPWTLSGLPGERSADPAIGSPQPLGRNVAIARIENPPFHGRA
jgi:hypothetical protein